MMNSVDLAEVTVTVTVTYKKGVDPDQLTTQIRSFLEEAGNRSIASAALTPPMVPATPTVPPTLMPAVLNPNNPAEVCAYLIERIGTPDPVERAIFEFWLANQARTSLADLVTKLTKDGVKDADERVRVTLRHLGKRLKYPGYVAGSSILPLRLLVSIKSDDQGRRHHLLTDAGRAALKKIMT